MAYTKQTWVDRKVEKPLTFLTTTNADGTITLVPYPGVIEQEGTKLSAERLNHIENGIADIDAKLSPIVPVIGKWTPAFNTVEGKAPTVTYTDQAGKYTKIGNLVFVDFYIRAKITALNGTNNYAVIEGLPFEMANKYFGQEPLTIGSEYKLVADETNLALVVTTGKKIKIQVGYGAGEAVFRVTPTDAPGYCQISGSGWYETT